MGSVFHCELISYKRHCTEVTYKLSISYIKYYEGWHC